MEKGDSSVATCSVVVAVSSPPGLFVPKSSEDVAVIVFRLNISLSRDIAVSPFDS